MMRHAITTTALAIFIAGCSGGSGSLPGGSSKPPQSETQAQLRSNTSDPKTRAVQVAWNVSRAAKCNFNLDNATLKTSYLNYETEQGMAPDSLPALEKAYEFARIETASRIEKQEGEYCTSKRVAETRTDLGRYLAGDFTARTIAAEKTVPEAGLFDAFDTGVKLPQKTSEDALKPKE
ncbi:MAG: hypothetical protein AAFZ01_08600 [Pseudomonadota bacterium]